ncbi:hypothetical protein CBS101457_004828 [Exobasidium rhododendri]|nr:hypothetical protein CBS101457_004828 [Exobasidium rhododendri]
MRESNFSNPFQNKACVCISAAVYDRRAIDCTATLPLINSLNHLAYLTSTSPRIREMVCLDGGLERLIRILRQVPRSPSQPSMRGIITKEMQSIWKWSLAFQCVVNIGVRGSENIRTRVVEAGMIPVAVRVLESYLRIADAIRDEKKREARKEEARMRLKNLTEATLQGATEVSSALINDSRRGGVGGSMQEIMRGEARPTTHRAESMSGTNTVMGNSSASTSRIDPSQGNPVNEAQVADVTSMNPSLDSIPIESVLSASSSSSSIILNGSEGHASSSHGQSGGQQNLVAAYPSGLLTNASSVEDFTASASGSDGAEDAEMEGEESEIDSTNNHGGSATDRSREHSGGLVGDSEDNYEEGDRSTPRPPRRALAPMVAGEQSRSGGVPAAWQAVSNVTMTGAVNGEGSTPRRDTVLDDRGRTVLASNPQIVVRQPDNTIGTATGISAAAAAAATTPAASAAAITLDDQVQAATRPTLPHPSHHSHQHHHHHHHHHTHRERPTQSDSVLHPSDMIYRDEEVLLSLQLLAYISKYAHVRTLFHCDLSLLSSLETLASSVSDEVRDSAQSWNPSLPSKKNVFCIAERYTLRSSRTGLSHFAANGESRIAPEIQYWAGVIMRNACRKDEVQGGIRQCANMLCGKWEKTPREFAKCRKCRKAKYCSKMCQSKGWQMGHRFWCSSRSDDDHPDAKVREKQGVTAMDMDGMAAVPGPVNTIAPTTATMTAPNHDEAMGDRAENTVFTPGAPAVQHRNVAVAIDDLTPRLRQPHHYHHQQQQQQPQHAQGIAVPQPTSSTGQVHANQSSTLRSQQRAYPSELSRRSSASSRPEVARRIPSAIPTHLQLPSSDDHQAGTIRNRTVSTASSGGEMSDMSDDEMERASRRVVANTVSPAQRSPGVSITPLANMTTADEMILSLNSSGGAEDVSTTTRTDLAGRPLPPPVIAQQDAGMANEMSLRMPPGEDMMAIGGRLTPGVHEENENAVFGRGDFDQMIWRGRTPVPEDHEDEEAGGRDARRRGNTVTGRNVVQPQDRENENEEGEVRQDQVGMYDDPSSTSQLNSALLLAGGSSTPRTSRTMAASPRFPSSHGILAPVARQPHRFASVTASSSPVASSSSSSSNVNASPSFVRGSLAGTFGDWRREGSSGGGHHHQQQQQHQDSQQRHQLAHSHGAAAGLGLNGHPTVLVSHSVGYIASAPAYTASFAQRIRDSPDQQGGEGSGGGLRRDDFVVPTDLQNLLNTVNRGDEMQVDQV